MWCSTCQREVSLLSPDSGSALSRCARCGTTLGQRPDASPSDAAALEQSLAVPPLPSEDWQIEADIQSVHRLVESLRGTTIRMDQPAALTGHHLPPEAVRERAAAAPPKANLATWALVSLGLATFVCGAVLLGWSFAAGREDLWPIGMPLALAGQAGLIVGLVLQLDGLWQSNRHTEKTLSALDDELSRVRHATTLLSSTRSTSAQSFYAHLAEGASPQLLLADLKGQLDLLAQQMASKGR